MFDSPTNPPSGEDFHRGLAALNFAVQNLDREGPEVAYFQRIIERHPGPALDAGCGTGRLLRRYLKAGLDVDGCDISPDLLSMCRRTAESEGLSPNLYEQATFQLNLPRTYDTIFLCGVFGLGGTRQHDLEAMRRLYRHLNDGGTLAISLEPGWIAEPTAWKLCAERDAQLPTAWGERGWTPTPQGDKLWGQLRIVSVDPLGQSSVIEIRNELEHDGEIVASELHVLVQRWYGMYEMIAMLETAGFHNITVEGDYTPMQVTADHETHVYLAKR